MPRPLSLAVAALALHLMITPVQAEPAAGEAPALAQARAALDQRDPRRALIHLQNHLQQAPEDQDARRLLVQLYLDLGQGAEAERALEGLRTPADGAAAPPGQSDRSDRSDLAPADLKDLGRALLLQGKYQRLIGTIDPGAAKGDNTRLRAELNALVGEAHLGQGEVKAARERLNQARTLDPANARALLGLARLALVGGDAAAAATLVDQALAADGSNAQASEIQGDLAFMNKDLRAADTAYSRVIAQAPRPWTVLIKRAVVRIDLNDLAGAAADIEAARTGDRDLPGLDLAEGALALRRGEAPAAVAHLESFLKSAPSNTQGLYLSALALARTARYTEALRRLEPLLTAKEQDPAVAVLHAEILLALGQGLEAEEALAVVGDPAGAPAVDQTLYRALVAQGRRSEAREVLKRLAEGAPERSDYQLALARDLAGSGDRAGARKPLERVLAADPANLEAGLALVRLELDDGDTAAALTRVRALARDRPQNARVQELLALALAASGDTAGARAAAERALVIDPRAQTATLTLAGMALEAKDAKGARAPLEALLRAEPKDTAALVLLAELDSGEGHPEAAVARLRKGLAAAPQDLKLRLALAGLLSGRGDAKAALAVLAETPPDQAGGAAVLRARGLAELAARRYGTAVETFEGLAVLVPGSAEPRYLGVLAGTAGSGPKEAARLAETLAEGLRLDPAHPMAARAIVAAVDAQPNDEAREALAARLTEVAPKEPELAFQRARLAAATGDRQAVLRYAEAAAALAPAAPRYRHALIQALQGAGKPGPARQSAEAWLAAHPDDLEARALLAQVALSQGDTKAAADAYRAILAKAPKSPLAQNNLALLLLPTDPKAALPLAEAAHAALPDRPDMADTLGAVLLALKEPARALPILEQAAAGGSTDPSLIYHLAAALAATGAEQRARDLLGGLAGKSFPEKEEAAALLARLSAAP